MNIHAYEQMQRECNNFHDENDKDALERDLTFISVFALHDELRSTVDKAIQYAYKGNIITRMVSGDHIDTAAAVAIKAGILTEDEAKM